jgi:alpha-D-ribose 1-methylphosphonate 5-triphosphate synthase subunit PhnL
MTKILKVSGLTKVFNLHLLGGKKVIGCKGISFHLKVGEVLGISGPSGSGKSTILKCIYRTYTATAGQAFYIASNGNIVELLRAPENDVLKLRQQEIGYVSQFLRVVPRVSAMHVVAEKLFLNGYEESQALKVAACLLEYLGIPKDLWEASPVTFSGGQQQRINIARAVVNRPRILLLDEPTASLDEQAKQRVNDLIMDLKQSGTAILIASHDQETLERVADRILFIDHIDESKLRRDNRNVCKVDHN